MKLRKINGVFQKLTPRPVVLVNPGFSSVEISLEMPTQLSKQLMMERRHRGIYMNTYKLVTSTFYFLIFQLLKDFLEINNLKISITKILFL